MHRPLEWEISWASIVAECRTLLEEKLLPLRANELDFLRLVNEEGTLRPELLTADDGLRAVIASHPALRWKVRNVRAHRGFDPGV